MAQPVQSVGPMRITSFVLAIATLAGCEKNLLKELPDAPPMPDASIDAPPSGCPTPAQPLAPGNFQVYLVTEGITLSKINGCDDSRTNCTMNAAADQTVVPPFLPQAADRQAFIAELVGKVEAQLAPYSIDIVTTRPTASEYDMIVLGGDPVSVTGGCPACTALTPFDCMSDNRHHIDLVFDFGEGTNSNKYVNTVLDDIGVMLGLAATTTPGDCMCRLASGCLTPPGPLCTYGRNLPVDTNFACSRATQDEPAMLQAALGCR
jgi:hypothetical protein